MAMRRRAMRLNSADFPTFGLPTMAINPDMGSEWSTARRRQREILQQQEPSIENDHDQSERPPGLQATQAASECDSLERCGYMCAIMLSPNCEHLISVAPSIWRAKSYVTRLLPMAPF